MDFLEKAEKLPEAARNFCYSNEFRIAIKRAVIAFDLPVEKTGLLSDIVVRIFVGDQSLDKIIIELSDNFGLEESVARGIALQVLKSIFEPFPDLFTNVIEVKKGFLSGAAAPVLSSSEVEKELIRLEPWLTIKAPETVLKERRNSIQDQKNNVLNQTSATLNTKIPLLKALADYPRLNEQLITAEKIRVKGQGELVRPSLSNWIRYYRDELGIGFHDQVTRGKFLFQSENGKKLSAEERERIHLVLKSLEEEFPLEINPEQGVIVFPTRTQPSPVSSAFPKQSELNAPARPVKPFTPNIPAPTAPVSEGIAVPVEKASFFSGAFGAGKNIAGDTLHFSTGHVLPSEKEVVSGGMPSSDTDGDGSSHSTAFSPNFGRAGISQNRGSALPRSPYSIRPLRMRNDTEHETENR